MVIGLVCPVERLRLAFPLEGGQTPMQEQINIGYYTDSRTKTSKNIQPY